MKINVKIGDTITTEDGFSKEAIRIKLDQLINEHKHICSSCCSKECNNFRSLDSPLITSGVSALDTTVVFDCSGYKKKIMPEDYLVFDYYHNSENDPSTYQPKQATVVNQKVKKYVMDMK
jgi:hypothetical protein